MINHKRVQRLMQSMRLHALYPKPRLSTSNGAHLIYPYRLAEMPIEQPNDAWSTDITYLKMGKGFVYLMALLDVYSRYVVAWNVSISMEVQACMQMLEEALKQGQPKVLNSDQGSQFTSEVWVQLLQAQGIEISMDGKGRCMDNLGIERFWRTIKYEEVYLKGYDSVPEARQNIRAYIQF